MKEPERRSQKNRPRRIALKMGISFLALAFLLIYLSQCGIRVTPPSDSPLEKYDQEAAAIFPNAAFIYEEAMTADAAYRDMINSWPNSLWRHGQSIPPHVAAWLDDQEPVVALLLEAAALENCRFRLKPIDDGVFTPWVAPMRNLANVVGMRARLAAERHDLPRFRESLGLIERMARHLQQQPTLLAFLIGSAVRAIAVDQISQPLTWPELSSRDRLSFIGEMRPLCHEKPLTAETWRRETELSCYEAFQDMDWKVRLLIPRSRLWGELTRLNHPVELLLSQSIEQQIDPLNPLLTPFAAGTPPRSIPRALANPARTMAEKFFISPTGLLDGQARIVTMQRGMRLLLNIVEHRETTGALPLSLSALPGQPPIEPYTGKPFHYNNLGNDFGLYADWEDRDDDGGRAVETRRNPATQWLGANRVPDGDRLFWPVEAMCSDPP